MDSTAQELQCKHNRLPRNCYLCYLHRNDNRDKTPMDTLHETISELKIRIAKLEEYKRLQDDDIREHHKQHVGNITYLTKEKIILEKRIDEFEDFHLQQIQHNTNLLERMHDTEVQQRHDGARLINLEDEITKINGWINALDTDCGSAHEKIIKLEQTNQQAIDANPIKDIYERFAEIERQSKNQNNINVILLDKFKSVIKDEIIKTKECMVATPIKTTGLDFEEAITVFKTGKKIKRKEWAKFFYLQRNEIDDNSINSTDILAEDWEIVE